MRAGKDEPASKNTFNDRKMKLSSMDISVPSARSDTRSGRFPDELSISANQQSPSGPPRSARARSRRS
jgi:hypothetical protein